MSGEVSHLIVRYVTDEYEWRVCLAWLVGGSAVAKRLVEESDCVKKAWGKGDKAKALALSKMFTLHMISHWYRMLDEQQQHLDEERKQAREVAASSMLRFFNTYLCPGDSGAFVKDLKDFMSMDMQFNWDCDKETQTGEKRLMTKTASLLLAKACEACGQRCVDWSRVTFPVESHQQLYDANAIVNGRPFSAVEEWPLLSLWVDAGVDLMFSYYRETEEDEELKKVRESAREVVKSVERLLKEKVNQSREGGTNL